ncbi:MAG: aldo/keto reductase [Spirochaetes bacterium]|nr:aldo/keto reductase [Spirochaetota bacterium]
MLYRKVPKSGEELSILGFGCMRLATNKIGKIDEKRAAGQIRYAIDQGVNYLDTAMPYHMGTSETFLPKALAGGYREKVKIATKLTPMYAKKFEDMDKVLNVQLKNLKTECIDYYLLHGLNRLSWETLRDLGVCDFLEKAKADGRIRYTGFSFHGDKDVFKEIIDYYSWEICQIQYNFMDENIQAGTEGLKYAASKNVGVIIMEPLRGGNLTKKIPAQVKPLWNEAKIKRNPAEWALRWLWNRPEITVVLSGMNREEHVEENIRAAEGAVPGSMTADELNIIKRVADKYRELTKIGCTGCRYCMPCPSGVDIPVCFELYNDRFVFNDKILPKIFYTIRLGDGLETGKDSFASQCKECGACEEKCPQHIPIMERLRDVSAAFESRGMRAVGWVLKKLTAAHRKRILRRGE